MDRGATMSIADPWLIDDEILERLCEVRAFMFALERHAFIGGCDDWEARLNSADCRSFVGFVIPRMCCVL